MRLGLVAALCLASYASAAISDTRLTDAAMRDDKDAVRSLLKEKIDINASQGDGATALHWAAYNDDLEMAKLLLAAGANIRAATREGAITPLFMACTNGNAAMIAEFLKAGADANSVKSNGTTALMTAASSGSAEAVKVLLDHGANVNAKESTRGQTALMFAAALNRSAVIKVLVAQGADPNVPTTVRKLERVRFDQDGNIVEDRPGRGAAGLAGKNPDAVALDVFAQALGLTAALYRPQLGTNEHAALDVFAHSVGFKSVAYLPDLNASKRAAKAGDVAARGPRKIGADFMGGMTALLYAAREGNMEAAQALIEANADVNEVSSEEHFSPIVMAIINGHYDVAKFLLDHGADPNLASISGLAALYATIDVQWAPKAWVPQPKTDQEKITYLQLMSELLDHGAKVNAQLGEKLWFRSFTNDYTWVDPAGATAFWRAAQSSDIAALRLLAAHGADPQMKNKDGDTPLMAAAGIGWAANWSINAPYPGIDAVKYCVELGNDVNAADLRGYTALHGAAYLGNNDMVNYLVSKGAKVDAKSKAGDSVADMANGPTRFGQPHADTVALLEKLGSPNSRNCRSDQCVIAAKAQIYDRRTPADYAQSEQMDAFAKSVGFTAAEYRVDSPAALGRGTGRGRDTASASAPPMH